jgi:hypothetical protein
VARAKGKKALTCIAVEVHEPKKIGRYRMQSLTDASAPSLHAVVKDHVEPGSTVITDAWPGYSGLDSRLLARTAQPKRRRSPWRRVRTAPANGPPNHLFGQAMAHG